MKIKLHYNHPTQEWIQRSMSGKFMQRYEDCANLSRQFPRLNKNVINIYDLPQARKIDEYPLEEDGLDLTKWG